MNAIKSKRWLPRPGFILTLNKLLLAVIISNVFFLLIFAMLVMDTNDEKWYYKEAPCKLPADVVSDSVELAARIHKILDSLKIPHYMCYGTLWGVIRMERLLPWDNDVDFCINNTSILKVEEATLYKYFQKYDLQMRYMTRYGLYRVLFRKAAADITVFDYDAYDGLMHRVGWDTRLYPLWYREYHSFPPRLIEAPLKMKKFHSIQLPVPHEEMEIQKYLYKDDWWKIVKPQGCTIGGVA